MKRWTEILGLAATHPEIMEMEKDRPVLKVVRH